MALTLKRTFWPTILFLLFTFSAGLIAYAFWLFQIDKGNRAYSSGNLTRASELYESAARPIATAPWLGYALANDFENLLFNHVAAHYRMGQFAEAAEKLQQAAEQAPFVSQSGEYSFWLGNLLFRNAVASKNPEEFLKQLKAALDEYERGLRAAPDHWDLKHNYEMTRKILFQKGQTPQTSQEKLKSLLDTMRPATDPAKQELPPEKRG